MKEEKFEVKQMAKVSPVLSGLEGWVEGIIIKIFKNIFIISNMKYSLKFLKILFLVKKLL